MFLLQSRILLVLLPGVFPVCCTEVTVWS